MDQIKIGKLIAECRREKQLTQAQLAERLNITDKAVSKWERGIALPDSSIMLEVCDILGISATELLCGERINMENYNKETEKKLLEMVKEKEEKDRQLLTLEWAIGILSLFVLLLPVLIGALAPISEEWVRIVVVFSGFLPAFVGFFFALKIEQIAGYYACGACGHRYVPTFKAVNLAPHMGRTRRMKCPKCGKKSWQKKVIGKE
jgi:transcriptional regulator with XRE-family HTH domain/DNA-directed RNA polymerase subunit RPC12/RpoP